MASDKRANRDEVSEDNLYHSKWSGSSGFFLTLYLMIAKLGIVCNSENVGKYLNRFKRGKYATSSKRGKTCEWLVSNAKNCHAGKKSGKTRLWFYL